MPWPGIRWGCKMVGHIQGVAACNQQSKSTVVYVHCVAHCTNMYLQTVGSQSLCVRESLDSAMGLGQLIQFSPKWSSLFETLQNAVFLRCTNLNAILSYSLDGLYKGYWSCCGKLFLVSRCIGSNSTGQRWVCYEGNEISQLHAEV